MQNREDQTHPDPVIELLQLVILGKTEAVTSYLTNLRQDNPQIFDDGNIIFEMRHFKDSCGHEWENLSPAYYAIWAGDLQMYYCLFDFPFYAGSDKLADSKNELRHRFMDAEKNDPSGCILAPLKNLIQAYKLYLANEDNWCIAEKERKFIEIVGTAQSKLPNYILYEICGANVFFPPTFAVDPMRECKYNNKEGKLVSLQREDLGITLALSRGNLTGATSEPRRIEDDLESLRFLYKERILKCNAILGDKHARDIIDSRSNTYEFNPIDFLTLAYLIKMPDYPKEKIKQKIDYDKYIGWVEKDYGVDSAETLHRFNIIILDLSDSFFKLKIPKYFSAEQVKEMISLHKAIRDYFYTYSDRFHLTLNPGLVDTYCNLAEKQNIKIKQYEDLLVTKQRNQSGLKLFDQVVSRDGKNAGPDKLSEGADKLDNNLSP